MMKTDAIDVTYEHSKDYIQLQRILCRYFMTALTFRVLTINATLSYICLLCTMIITSYEMC